MEKMVAGLMVVGLVIILAVSFLTKGTPTAQVIGKPVKVCSVGDVKDVKQIDGALGIKLFEYTLCSEDGAWTGPHTGTSLPGGNQI